MANENNRRICLSTIDNPWNPFTQSENWRTYDVESEAFCCEYLARVANTNEAMSDEEVQIALEDAIDQIVSLDPTNRYIKLVEEKENGNKSNQSD